jgi:hypothetical protein
MTSYDVSYHSPYHVPVGENILLRNKDPNPLYKQLLEIPAFCLTL